MDTTAPSSGPGAGVQATAAACTTEQMLLGEGARWDARRGELLRVDILAGRVFRDRVTADGTLEPVADYTIPGTVGALAPIDGDEGWLVAAGRGFLLLRPDGSQHALGQVASVGTRMNDGACDPQGRFWAGRAGSGIAIVAGQSLRVPNSCGTRSHGIRRNFTRARIPVSQRTTVKAVGAAAETSGGGFSVSLPQRCWHAVRSGMATFALRRPGKVRRGANRPDSASRRLNHDVVVFSVVVRGLPARACRSSTRLAASQDE